MSPSVRSWDEGPIGKEEMSGRLEDVNGAIVVGHLGGSLVAMFRDRPMKTWGRMVRDTGWIITGFEERSDGETAVYFAPATEVFDS